MVDLVATRAHAKGAAPSTSHEGRQTVVVVTTPLSTLPPPSTNRVDMLFLQLVEIHAIAATQLVECAHWRQSKGMVGLLGWALRSLRT
jgi:hypothetical protein